MAKWWGAAAAGVCLALISQGAAQATRFVVTYEGVVSSGTDATRMFGGANDLAGASFTSAYRLNSNLGVYTVHRGEPLPLSGFWPLEQLLGGPFVGASSPVVASSITIDGATLQLGRARVGYHETGYDPLPTPSIETGADHFAALSPNFVIHEFLNNYIIFPGAFPADPNLLPALISEQTHAGDFQFGGGSFSVYAGSTGFGTVGGLPFARFGEEELNAPAAYAFGQLSPRSMSVRVLTDGAPEPASWALMLMGFGGLGLVIRRRQAALPA